MRIKYNCSYTAAASCAVSLFWHCSALKCAGLWLQEEEEEDEEEQEEDDDDDDDAPVKKSKGKGAKLRRSVDHRCSGGCLHGHSRTTCDQCAAAS